MTGERYVSHVAVVEETMGAKQPEVQQTDSQSAAPSKKQSVFLITEHVTKLCTRFQCHRCCK